MLPRSAVILMLKYTHIYQRKMRQISHSQNFIQNQKILETLIKKSSITHNDLVIEIGAGNGEITKILSKFSKEVIAIEKDKRLFQHLSSQTKHLLNVTIQNQDIFRFNFPINKAYKVFSNIPFNYTADILRLLSSLSNLADDIYLFIQQKAALNYLGSPKTKESLKSLFIKLHFKPSIVYQFKRSHFSPIPKVDIVLLRLEKHPKPLLDQTNITQFKDFVVYAFSQTKPNLKEGLKCIFTSNQFNQIIKDLKIKSKYKPRDLFLEQWFYLYDFFVSNVKNKKKYIVANFYQKLILQQKNLKKIHRTRIDKNWKIN
jgi:23S rRNA (adenine-N6)-dimethyltransferase